MAITRFCFPYVYVAEYLKSTKRPAGFPGQNLYYSLNQTGCINSTTATTAVLTYVPYVPYEDRCWPSRNMHEDVAAEAMELDDGDRQTPSNYAVWVRNTSFVCHTMLDEECITRYGPLGCVKYMQGGMPPAPPATALQPSAAALSPLPPPPPPSASVAGAPASAGPSASRAGRTPSASTLAAGLAGGLGGAVVLALAATGLALLLRRRRLGRCASGAGGRKDAYEAREGAHGSSYHQDTGSSSRHGLSMSRLASTFGRVKGSNFHVVVGGGVCAAADAAQLAAAASLPQRGQVLLTDETTGELDYRCDSTVAAAAALPAAAEASSAYAVVSQHTPAREDVCLGVECGNEVQLLGTVLGKGGYGRVMEGTYNGQVVAVKLIELAPLWALTHGSSSVGAAAGDQAAAAAAYSASVLSTESEQVIALQQEVEVLARCDHPNVVRLLAANLSPPRPCLVMERCETSLERLLYGGGAPGSGARLPLSTVLHIGTEVARGLAFLHPTILHRDLKPANVLINNAASERPEVKLTANRPGPRAQDFGQARLRCTALVTDNPEVGTPPYMAPECFDVNNYRMTHKADMYSFGVLLAEMLAGSPPWPQLRIVEIAYQVTLRKQRPSLLEGLGGERCPRKLRRLIMECWERDPQRRPAAEDAVKVLLLLLQQQQQHQGRDGTESPTPAAGDVV
ncbi:hypothetical protein GPECTOR_27g708 [Gonium pectorale]|uniref:Protein kinase domain-containing protein n=1 Tax=Gonium pectorale TaxID=33097 RepID=A0A150GFA6_GONPE|nr:hypothetical protein GPECTOR_27g708 [Gonium pectorale]|eukprot:KXZ48537.1 hypothetical protein GPECTOR_27g708 [Gonium pectorale]